MPTGRNPIGAGRARRARAAAANETPIVPRNSIAGRALVAVIAIMTFLACLTTGAVMLVQARGQRMAVGHRARGDDPGRPGGRAAIIDADVPEGGDARARLARHRARCGLYSKEESARLLEPWLGTGLALDELPVPRADRGQARAGAGARSRRIARDR